MEVQTSAGLAARHRLATSTADREAQCEGDDAIDRALRDGGNRPAKRTSKEPSKPAVKRARKSLSGKRPPVIMPAVDALIIAHL